MTNITEVHVAGNIKRVFNVTHDSIAAAAPSVSVNTGDNVTVAVFGINELKLTNATVYNRPQLEVLVNVPCFVEKLTEVVAVFNSKTNFNTVGFVASFLAHRSDRRNTLIVDERGINTLHTTLDSNDGEVVGEAESTLRTKTKTTDKIISFSLSGFKVSSEDVANLLFVKTNTIVTNREPRLKRVRKMNIKRSIIATSFGVRVNCVTRIFTNDCADLVSVQTA